jgi:hypothetical protein
MDNISRKEARALEREIQAIRRELEMPDIREQIRDAANKKLKHFEERLRRLLTEKRS